MHVERIYVVKVVTVISLLSKVLGIVVSVVSANIAFLSSAELATMMFSITLLWTAEKYYAVFVRRRILSHLAAKVDIS